MPRLPESDMVHAYTGRAALPASGDGARYDDPKTYRGVVDGKLRQVIDQRADSETRGTEITASYLIVTQLERYLAPGSLITVWPGTPAEHEGQVVAALWGDHPKAPRHAEMWIE